MFVKNTGNIFPLYTFGIRTNVYKYQFRQLYTIEIYLNIHTSGLADAFLYLCKNFAFSFFFFDICDCFGNILMFSPFIEASF